MRLQPPYTVAASAGTPLGLAILATGRAPLTDSAASLPTGLSLAADTGLIIGTMPAAGLGRASKTSYRWIRVNPQPPSLLVLSLIYAAFVSLGLPDGILGAAWPQMRVQFTVELNGNWLMLTLGTGGGMLSSFFGGSLLRRLGVRRVLILTTLLTATVVHVYALSLTFAAITTLSFLLGLGNGAIDAGLNNFVASSLSSQHMNWLHACWGVGISLGTLIVSGALAAGSTWRTAYFIVGLIQLRAHFDDMEQVIGWLRQRRSRLVCRGIRHSFLAIARQFTPNPLTRISRAGFIPHVPLL